MARKILLADDSVTAQNMGRKILADAGYEVITVNNGSAALKRIAEAKPDLIVLDVYMPGYSGLEVCQRLKDSNDTARIPILLTVGKLEPFKPEEAKRVRAEAFIVKPFEASELLSALTKLEDKMVPRADSSKPGRFARAIAAVEEGRYDKTVAIDEDSGWKSRIAFPRKKKEKAPEVEDADDPAVYNPLNRDLKTAVEHKRADQPAHTPAQPPVQPGAQHEQAQVDLGALVAHGLPKDATPEEIAALAAAAAQVQGISEGRSSESVSPGVANAAETLAAESKAPEAASSQTEQVQSEGIESGASSGKSANAQVAETTQAPVVAPGEARTDEAASIEAKEGVVESAASPEKTPGEMTATFAAENLQQQGETEPESKPADVPKEDAVAAGIETSPPIASFGSADVVANSANDGSVHTAPLPSEGGAFPAVSTVAAAPSRWTAVAVALAPEEAGITLEEEMRKAQAAAAIAALPAAPVMAEDRVVDEPPAHADPALVAETLSVVPEAEAPAKSSSGSPEPAIEESPVAAASAIPVVKDFETVMPREPEPSPAVAEAAVESAPAATSIAMDSAEVTAAVPSSDNAQDTKMDESFSALVIQSSANPPYSAIADQTPVSEEVSPSASEMVAALADEKIPVDTQQPETTESAESSAEQAQAPDRHTSKESEEIAAVAAGEEVSGGFSEVAKKESEIAANTAAAWASWRRIRETDGKGAETGTSPRDEAAMAVAAGAEKAPEDASDDAEVSPEIASIVDTVLADLRPKIVEEISKKMGKKKK